MDNNKDKESLDIDIASNAVTRLPVDELIENSDWTLKLHGHCNANDKHFKDVLVHLKDLIGKLFRAKVVLTRCQPIAKFSNTVANDDRRRFYSLYCPACKTLRPWNHRKRCQVCGTVTIYHCNSCAARFVEYYQVRNHEQRYHKNFSYFCFFCDMPVGYYKRHLHYRHYHCGKGKKSDVRYYMMSNSENKQFCCSKCKHSCFTLEELKRHVQSKHNENGKPELKSLTKLDKHFELHRRREKKADGNNNKINQSCPRCGKTFARLKSLNLHKRVCFAST